jgi:uncharacterized protein YcbK (DUF882 family)
MSVSVFLVVAVFGAARVCSGTDGDVMRYFHHGDGKIKLINEKSSVSFQGRYRDGRGSYDQNALRAIHQVFGAEFGKPISAVSLRLIEFIDFLQDHFGPWARVSIVSGYRSPQYNTALRDKGRLAAKASLHQYGMAADIEIEGVSAKDVWNYVKEIGFGGAGYYHGELVHVDVGPARSWDEKSSGVGTDISEQNKLIGIVTDYDVYRPKDTIVLRFIRMTAFPIGVSTEWEIERVREDGTVLNNVKAKPSFLVAATNNCPHFGDIGEMLGIQFLLPGDLPPGRYRIRVPFCNKEWEAMPDEITTPHFEIANPASREYR